MIEAWQSSLRDIHQPAAIKHSKGDQAPLLKFSIFMCILVTIALLPVLRWELPVSLALADLFMVMTMPLTWLYLIRLRRSMRLPYILGMWLIVLGSLTGTLAAIDQFASLIQLVKGIYLYVWFVTLVGFLSNLQNRRYWHLILLVWLGTILLHGSLLLAQFLSPAILQATTANVGHYGTEGAYRPIGLTTNANMAASFQLTGIVPLLLIRPPKKIAFILGLLIVAMVIATGSMGATLAVIGSLTVFFVLRSFVVGNGLKDIVTMGLLLAVLVLLLGLGTSFYFSHHPDQLEHVKYMYYGRAERSAEGRFELWETALGMINSRRIFWGIGIYNFLYYARTEPHNDLLAFLVERGLLGGLGLTIFAITIAQKPIRVLLNQKTYSDQAWPALVLLVALISISLQSLTHQVFHFRFFWLVFAMQESLIIFKNETKPSPSSLKPSQNRHPIVVQPGVTSHGL